MIIKLASINPKNYEKGAKSAFLNGPISNRAGHYVAKAKIVDLLKKLHTDPKSLTVGETATLQLLKAKSATKAFIRKHPKAVAGGAVGLVGLKILKSLTNKKTKSFDKTAEDWSKLVNQAIGTSKLSSATKLMGSSAAANAVKVISTTPSNVGTSFAKGIGNVATRLGQNLTKVKAFK